MTSSHLITPHQSVTVTKTGPVHAARPAAGVRGWGRGGVGEGELKYALSVVHKELKYPLSVVLKFSKVLSLVIFLL